jgi:hypothetical protein
MEIDHFFPKSIYPDLVLEWTNLNPSCKTCNASKGDHDPRREPVVNPFLDDPKQYLCFRNYLYFGKDAGNKGQKTIEVLNLNDRTQFVEKRARVGFQLSGHLEELYNNRDLFLEPDRQYLNRLKRLMREGNRKEEYAALTSTIILENECFQLLKTYLESCDLWDSELDTLMLELTFCALL